MLERSFGEIAALAKRATRGAGYAWGACEDAASATEWLSRQGLPGVQVLSNALSAHEGPQIAPTITEQPWKAANGALLCALTTAAALTDHIQLAAHDGGIAILNLRFPLLTVGCVGAYGEATGRRYQLKWNDTQIDAGLGGSFTEDPTHKLISASANMFRCTELEAIPARATQSSPTRPSIDVAHWKRLEQLAFRTYAPATAASRLSGAGPDAG